MFLDENFMLTTETAKKLFHTYAKNMPIIDYHCHLNPQEIFEDKNFNNITEAWITEGNNFGDHYKWRLMRANGVPEELITGQGDPYEKFLAFAGVLEKAYGNPIFEWCHLELRRFFGIEEVLTTETAPIIWEQANKKLKEKEFSRRQLIRNSNVRVVSTTDDPIDDLHWHELLAKEELGFKVIPGFRPDKALNIANKTFPEYIRLLGTVSKVSIQSFKQVVQALETRIDYFEEHNGSICDHALDSVRFEESSEEELDLIFLKGSKGEGLTDKEIAKYRSALLVELFKIYAKHEWSTQLHMHAIRNVNTEKFALQGPDTGYDAINDETCAQELAALLSAVSKESNLPRIVLYSLNPNDFLPILTVMGAFQGGLRGKLQFGTAWWFNDTRTGMRNQLEKLSEQSLLGNFVGMLTDSRSFLSYPRHEYFRRVLCEYLGELVARGQVPDDEKRLGKMVQDICYNNADHYFRF